MPHDATVPAPTVPVAALKLGSWQVSLDRQALELESLQRSYDKVADRWDRLIARLKYRDAYRCCFRSLPNAAALLQGAAPIDVLDCGIGTGELSLALIQSTSRPIALSGIDISHEMLTHAGSVLAATRADVRLSEGDAARLPYPDQHFDLVMGAHFLEHFADPAEVLAEMHRVLRPGGTLFVCLTKRSLLGFWIHLRWRAQMLSERRARALIGAAGFQSAQKLAVPTPGPFRHMSFAMSATKAAS